jgi:hypothetical protein
MSTRQRAALPTSVLTTTTTAQSISLRQSSDTRCEQFKCPSNLSPPPAAAAAAAVAVQSSCPPAPMCPPVEPQPQLSTSPPSMNVDDPKTNTNTTTSTSTRAVRQVFESFFGSHARAPATGLEAGEPVPEPLTFNETALRMRAHISQLDVLSADLHVDNNKKDSDPKSTTDSPLVGSSPILSPPAVKFAPSSSSPIAHQSAAIHAFLITQDYFTFTCEFLQSAILNGVVPHIIGFEGPDTGTGGRFSSFNWGLGKPILSLRAPIEALVARLGGDTLVLITDAHDTLLTTSGAALALKFRSFQVRFPLARVVIAAERSCFPIEQEDCDRFPPTDPPNLPYTNLNSGTLIGEGRHILNVLDAVELMYPNGLSFYTMNDQAALQYLYLDQFARRLLGLQLDYASELFMCMHMAQKDIQRHPSAPYRTCNIISGACPAILHFNGGSKDLQKPMDAEISSSLAASDSSPVGEDLRRKLAEYDLPELNVTFRAFCCDTRWTDPRQGNKVPISSMRCEEKDKVNWAK